MSFSLEKAWSDLEREEAQQKLWNKRRRISGVISGMFYVLFSLLGSFLVH